jgi:putative peptidoglycan lipid II flippase
VDTHPTSDTESAAAGHRRIFLRSAGIVTASVFLSRVLGFSRDWTLAHQVGSNSLTDAYNVAFTIPDILSYLLAGGALSITFLPVFLEYFTSEREDEAWHVFSIVLSFTCSLLAVLIIVAEIYAPVITTWIAPGFSFEQQQMVTRLTRIMLPAQAFFFIGGILSAVQYAQGRFVIPYLAPLVYNGGIILGGALFARRLGIESFSWGVLAGSLVGNCLIQIWGATQLSARFRYSLDLRHPGFRRFFRLTVPIMLGFSVIFIDDWAIRWFGSYLESSSISWLSYAKRLMLVIVAVFGQAAGVATYPILARLAAQKKWQEMCDHLEDALRHVMLAVIPISVLLALVSRPAVYILYSRTRLSVGDIDQTALALEIFLISAVAWGTQSIIGRGFYALGDTLTPTVIGSVLALLSIPIYWVGQKYFAHLGLAAASSIGVTTYTAVLWAVLFRRLKIPFAGLASYFARACAAAAGAGVVCLAIKLLIESRFPWTSFTGSVVQGITLSAVFLLMFLAIASLLRVASWRDLTALVPLKPR